MDGGKEFDSTHRSWSRSKIVLVAFLTIAAYFLWTEHKAHVVQFLPYGLLLLCPLLHFFHGGHGGHGGHHRDETGGERR